LLILSFNAQIVFELHLCETRHRASA
jgi:hypothetical protein